MKSAERRAGEKERVQSLILNAARELLLEVGLEGFSMRKLGEKIGYTPTGIYFHFPDKDRLLQALLDADCTALLEGMGRLKELPNPVARIMACGAGYIQFALKHPNHYRLMFMTPGFNRDLELTQIERGNPTVDGYAFFRSSVTEAIAQGHFRPECQDVELVAQMLWAGVHGIASLHIAKGQDPWFEWRSAEATTELALVVMMRGLLRDPSQLPTLEPRS